MTEPSAREPDGGTGVASRGGPHGAQPLGSGSRESGPQGSGHRAAEPRVVGVCFAQELGLSGLVAEDWDLRIPAAVTENGTHTFTT